jgi:general L-amino acid transport system substrate-binding protein
MRKFKYALGAALLLAGLQAAQAGTLDVVKQRGVVNCGVTTGFAGFSAPDAKGQWQGLDVDMCRAVAAAVLGDASKFKAVPLNSQQRFTALQSGEIDLLARNTTVTQQRDTALGAISAGVNFYDGQGFLVPKSLGVKSAKELNGASVCMQTGTSNENTMADWARANNVQYKPVVIEQFNEVVNAFAAGRCDVFTTDASGLASIRIS